ncbi:MAG: hypothetical protein L0196_04430 [candidate division Zixibacteria bacterium]|nr:hypothetical protein [candidate division Zixibacteria bacterium]
MTISDWVGIIQAIILLITAGILLYYTIETRKLRVATNEQTVILREQLNIQLGISKPFFQLQPNSYSATWVRMIMTNRGGPAFFVGIECSNGFLIKIDQIDYLGPKDQTLLTIEGKNIDGELELPFKIKCLDSLGNKHRFDYVY